MTGSDTIGNQISEHLNGEYLVINYANWGVLSPSFFLSFFLSLFIKVSVFPRPRPATIPDRPAFVVVLRWSNVYQDMGNMKD